MQPTHISSRDNSLLKLARTTRDGKSPDLIFLEGFRLCEEALRSGLDLHSVIYSDEIGQKDRAAAFLKRFVGVSTRVASVSEKLLTSISNTTTPQGIVALARRPESGPERLLARAKENPLLVVMHRTNNPVNVGAIIRSAEAAGVTGVIATVSTSDPFSPKALRGAMGSAFRVPIWFGATYAEALAWCKEKKIRTVCADISADKSFTEIDWTLPTALIVGPEATGLSAAEVAAASEVVKIPMQGEVESLNVSVAAGILLFEAARQRSN